MNLKQFVRTNTRLNFKESNILVERFIAQRAKHYNIDLTFCDSFPEVKPDKDQLVIFSDVLSPFSDYDELRSILKKYETIDWSELEIQGMIPGTGFVSIKKASTKAVKKTYFSHTQEQTNSQLNIFKYKRLKMFLHLLNSNERLHQYSVNDLITYLKQENVEQSMVFFAEKLPMKKYDACPCCQSKVLEPMSLTDSQPLTGYITKFATPYSRCLNCEVIFLNPCPLKENLAQVYDEFDRQDFVMSTNFPYDENSLRGNFIKKIKLPTSSATLDLGGGIGRFSEFLIKNFPKWSVCHSDFSFKQYPELEKLGIKTRALDFTSEEIGKKQYDLITMWEVVEHIHPERLFFAFDNIANALTDEGRFVFSTPNFDSPLCKTLDFYGMCLPFHTFVFSETWLKDFFKNHPLLELEQISYCSDFFDDYKGWMGYAKNTSISMAARSFAEFNEILHDEIGTQINKESLAAKAKGTEVIFCLKKKNNVKR